MRRFEAGENEDGMRLSRFVQRVTRGLPESQMYKGFRNKRIKVNARRQPPEYRLATGDVIELYLNDEFFPGQANGGRQPAAAGPLPEYGTVYEDVGVAILYKPAGVLSHRGQQAGPNLLDAFTRQLARAGAYDPAAENTFAPALCNRLDRGTEGLIIAAKTAPALREMNAIIRLGLLRKTYLCVCAAAPPQGLHTAWHSRNRANRTVTVTGNEQPGTRPICTGVQVEAQAGGLFLCRVALHTGRTHQIRAHLAHLGAPLVGDLKYGGPPPPEGLDGQALCAYGLAFDDTLPQGSGLAHLAGRTFTAGAARLPRWWREWARQHA